MTKEKKLLYRKAYSELYVIMQNLTNEEKNKIPKDFVENLLEESDKDYSFSLDETKPLLEQDLMVETKALLIQVYRQFIMPEEENEKWKKYDRFCYNKIEASKEAYDADKIFKNNKKSKNIYDDENNDEDFENEGLITTDNNNSLIKKIIDKIKGIFKKNKKEEK